MVNPHAETGDTTPVAESAGTSGDEEQGDGERRSDEEEEGPSQAEGPPQVNDTSVGELSIPTWGGVLLRNGNVVGSVGPLSQGNGGIQADAEKAKQMMTEQSQLFAAEIQATADTPAAESERLTGLAAQMRTIAEHWRDSGHDEGWQDQEGNAITASAHYVSLAESIEATATENHQIAQQNADERVRVEQHNADAQDAVTRFDGAEASALSRLQDGTATTADYAHVADTYAQMKETWQEDTGNNLVQIPVAGSVQPLNPEANFERQERLYRRLAGDASKNEEAARVAATPATQLEDPEGGVAPPPSPRVVYNRVTAGGEFVQESTPRGVRYVYEDTGQSLGYQTTEGLAAINPHPYGPPQLIYSTVTHGGEVAQTTTKPADVHYVANDGRVLGKETPEGLVRVSKGIFDPAPPDVDAAGIPSARPQRVENPDAPDAPRPVQVATPQPAPDPDAARYMSVDPDGMPLAWNPDGTLNYEANIRFSTDAGKQLLYTMPVVGTGLTVYDASRDGQWTTREMVMTGLSAAGDMLMLTPGKYLSAVGGAVVRGGRFTHTRMFAQDAPWSDAIKMASSLSEKSGW